VRWFYFILRLTVIDFDIDLKTTVKPVHVQWVITQYKYKHIFGRIATKNPSYGLTKSERPSDVNILVNLFV